MYILVSLAVSQLKIFLAFDTEWCLSTSRRLYNLNLMIINERGDVSVQPCANWNAFGLVMRLFQPKRRNVKTSSIFFKHRRVLLESHHCQFPNAPNPKTILQHEFINCSNKTVFYQKLSNILQFMRIFYI